ncbi:MAG: MotA/TolQ/ExbB proton channel family protein [Pirellulaceae bacterium]|nr:MotA/TolQ/ExbB proton channel family protein [Pirellulaceae bacterium]
MVAAIVCLSADLQPMLLAEQAPSEPDTPGAIISQAQLESLVSGVDVPGSTTPQRVSLTGMNFLRLLIDGGALMIPIGLMSLLVLAIALERGLALRRKRLFPTRLRREIRRAVEDEAPLSPPEIYRFAEVFPSSANRVLVDLLSKTGRPVPEMETVLSEGIQREADRLYGNVRWLTMAAAVTPLLGLLGTVWGMIIAFYNTTQLSSGSNRAEFLAEGIYIALVTTLAGLAVAIPAAILAHFFEGRITKNLGIVEVELRRLIPRLEAHEGRTRYDINARGISARPIATGGTNTATANTSVSAAGSESPSTPLRGPKLKL